VSHGLQSEGALSMNDINLLWDGTLLPTSYLSNTGMNGNIVLTSSVNFQVQEIETFEITD
jgi:hypothetical protein